MKKSVLIIEDDKNIAKAQAMILQEAFIVHHAYDGDQGLKAAKELKPDIILLDLMLPKRGGYDVCFNLRQNKELSNSKIVMVTAKNQPIDEDKGILVGADDYIMKPFEPEELLHIIYQVMKK